MGSIRDLTRDDVPALVELHRQAFEDSTHPPAAYFEEASSINFSRSVRYGLGVLGVSLQAFLHRKNLAHPRIFDPNGRRLDPEVEPENTTVLSVG